MRSASADIFDVVAFDVRCTAATESFTVAQDDSAKVAATRGKPIALNMIFIRGAGENLALDATLSTTDWREKLSPAQRGTKTRKFRTGRFQGARRVRGPAATVSETHRSADLPPSRFSAEVAFQPAGSPVAIAFAKSAKEQGEARPIHQRELPSQRIAVRALVLVVSRPPTIRPFSTNIGPAWMSSRIASAVERPSVSRRVMCESPALLSYQIPLPSEEAEFHAPADFPAETTSPRGAPSGVKNPAFAAAIA